MLTKEQRRWWNDIVAANRQYVADGSADDENISILAVAAHLATLEAEHEAAVKLIALLTTKQEVPS